jgi:hypothetical protein
MLNRNGNPVAGGAFNHQIMSGVIKRHAESRLAHIGQQKVREKEFVPSAERNERESRLDGTAATVTCAPQNAVGSGEEIEITFRSSEG